MKSVAGLLSAEVNKKITLNDFVNQTVDFVNQTADLKTSVFLIGSALPTLRLIGPARPALKFLNGRRQIRPCRIRTAGAPDSVRCLTRARNNIFKK